VVAEKGMVQARRGHEPAITPGRQPLLARPKRKQLFRDLHCEEILYRIKITHDKFDYPAFTKALGQSPKPGEWGDVVCPSRDADYHVHIAWKDEETLIRLQIGHYTDETEASLIPKKIVYAEECMKYLGQFFTNEHSQAHIHADFEFESGKHSRFPLPLRTTIGACKAEIDAIGLRLSEAPSGVSQVWIVQRKDGRLSAQLFADRRVIFASFSVSDDIKDLSSVIDSLTEEVRS
jgi:hypothetical protein